MTTYPNIGLSLPVQGDAGAGDWDTVLDENTALTDAHDHSSGKGVRITPAAININADLPLNSSWGITTANRISFASVAAPSTNKSVFVSDGSGGLTANELYWRSNTGTNVKITASNALNVAAFVGGIGGDYSSVSALVDYDDATDTYRFRQEINTAVRQFAKVRFADIQLVEYDAAGDASVPANAITIKSPDALAANYSVTMPAALPAATRNVSISSAGQISFSDSFGDRVGTISGCAANANSNITYTSSFGSVVTSGGAATLFVSIPLNAGDRIKSVSFIYSGDGAVDVTVDVVTLDGASLTSIGTSNITNAAGGTNTLTIDVTDTTVTTTMSVFTSLAANAAGFRLQQVLYTYDHP